jgi:hypothetical protein
VSEKSKDGERQNEESNKIQEKDIPVGIASIKLSEPSADADDPADDTNKYGTSHLTGLSLITHIILILI